MMFSVFAHQAYIGGNPADWDIEHIRSVLEDLEPELISNVGDFVAALHDYADSGYIPYGANDTEKFMRPSAKPVPMINEISMSNSLQLVSQGGYQWLVHRIYVTIEAWHPYPVTPDGPWFKVDITDYPAVPIVTPPFDFGSTLNWETLPVSPFFSPAADGYTLFTYRGVQHQLVNEPYQPALPATFMFGVQLDVQGNIRVLDESNAEVDVVYGPWNYALTRWIASVSGLILDGPEVRVGGRSYSVIDPRINWSPTLAFQWQAAPPTPGSLNANVSGPASHVTTLYSVQSPIQTILALTNLLFNADLPWTPIRIFNDYPSTSARIMDRLTINPNGYGTPYTWLVEHGFTNDIDVAETLHGENGLPLWQSFIAGLDPLDSQSFFHVTPSDTPPGITFDTITGRFYTIYYIDDLIDLIWARLLTNDVPGTGEPVTIDDDQDVESRAYRIEVRRP